MIQIDDKIISKDIFEKQFICDLNACKGACCVEGDSGAPLKVNEVEILNEIYPLVRPYLSKKSQEVIDDVGVSVLDADGDLTTPLINNKECAFVILDDGISKCGIEKANFDKKISFKKPISCHLFPIRISEYKEFHAINYESIDICSPACSLGKEMSLPVYKFLKHPLIRRYGTEFYNDITKIAKLLDEEKKAI